MINVYKDRYNKKIHDRIIVDCDVCKKVITHKPGYHIKNTNDLCLICVKKMIKNNKLIMYTKNLTLEY